jgi:hypothetical protein
MPRRSADYWLGRAEEARTMAEDMRDPQAREAMLLIVTQYEFLAERTRKLENEEREEKTP